MGARDAELLALAREVRRALDALEAALGAADTSAAEGLLEAVFAEMGIGWFTVAELIARAGVLAELAAQTRQPPPVFTTALGAFGSARAVGMALAAASADPDCPFRVTRGSRERAGHVWRVQPVGCGSEVADAP